MQRGLWIAWILVLVAACGPTRQETGSRVTPRSTPGSSGSPAGTTTIDIPNATMVYYDISGETEAELREQIDARRPTGTDGEKHDASTTWLFRWNWPGYGRNTCTLDSAKVTAEIKVIFPRWKAPKAADPDVVGSWNDYMQALAEHEKGHVDRVVERQDSVTEAIKAADCTNADDRAEAAVEAINQVNVEYDAETNHGETQGARFP